MSTTPDEPEPRPDVGPLAEPVAPDTLLDQLAERRRAIAETREKLIPVPGYDEDPPLLLINYRLLDGPEIDRMTTKVMREVKGRWDRNMTMAVDTFIAACLGIFVDPDGKGKDIRPLQYQGEPVVGFSEELALALKFREELPEQLTARAVVFGLFGNNDVSIAAHNMQLNAWFRNTATDVTMEFLGGNP